MHNPSQVATLADLDRLGDRIISDIGQQLQDMMSRIGESHVEVIGRLDRLEAGQTRLEAGQEDLRQRMTTLEVRMAKVEDRLTRVENRLTIVEGSNKALDADIRDFGKMLGAVQKKVDRLETLTRKDRQLTARRVAVLEHWAERIGQQAGIPFAKSQQAKT